MTNCFIYLSKWVFFFFFYFFFLIIFFIFIFIYFYFFFFFVLFIFYIYILYPYRYLLQKFIHLINHEKKNFFFHSSNISCFIAIKNIYVLLSELPRVGDI